MKVFGARVSAARFDRFGLFLVGPSLATNVSATAGDGRDWGLVRGSGGLVRF